VFAVVEGYIVDLCIESMAGEKIEGTGIRTQSGVAYFPEESAEIMNSKTLNLSRASTCLAHSLGIMRFSCTSVLEMSG
jgi:hypothetical protein